MSTPPETATPEPTTHVSVRLPVSMKANLDSLARSTGRNRNALMYEALRRFIDVERWQIADIEAGIREADAGDFATAEEMDALWSKYHATESQSRFHRGITMQLPFDQPAPDDTISIKLEVPNRVLIAFDQLSQDEQAKVINVLRSLARYGLSNAPVGLDVQRLAGTEPLYAVRATPDLRVIVRVAGDAPIEVVDILRPAALRNFANAV